MKDYKGILQRQVLKYGWKSVSNMVGFENLYRIGFDSNIVEYIELLGDIDIIINGETKHGIIITRELDLFCFDVIEDTLFYNHKVFNDLPYHPQIQKQLVEWVENKTGLTFISMRPFNRYPY